MKLKQLFEAEYQKDIYLGRPKRAYGKGLPKLVELPHDLPEKVDGYFCCSVNKLTSLEHCPYEVGGDFSCSYNKLTSLEHCPSEVGGDFGCFIMN